MFQPQPTSFIYGSGERPPSQLQLQLQLHGLGVASHADYGLYSSTAACTPPPPASRTGHLAPQANNGTTFNVAPAPPRLHCGLQLDHRSTVFACGVQDRLCSQRHLQSHQARHQDGLLLNSYLPVDYGYGRRLVKMADSGIHDMAAQQEAAKDYQPNLEVGDCHCRDLISPCGDE